MFRGLLLTAALVASHTLEHAERSVGWIVEELFPLPEVKGWTPPPGCKCKTCSCGKTCQCGQ